MPPSPMRTQAAKRHAAGMPVHPRSQGSRCWGAIVRFLGSGRASDSLPRTFEVFDMFFFPAGLLPPAGAAGFPPWAEFLAWLPPAPALPPGWLFLGAVAPSPPCEAIDRRARPQSGRN